MTVIPFRRWVARALVIEQLNADQWHVVTKGWPVPQDSLEGHAGGVNDFDTVVKDALLSAELTGLPVFVEAYLDTPRPLSSIAR